MKNEGVPKINIRLLQLLFTLMFLLLSFESWHTILAHRTAWEPTRAAAWCMWGGYSIIAFIGIRQPLKMLPIVLFEIIYKTTWLIIVALPLYRAGTLVGSPAEGMARIDIWVIFPIIAMPWRYFFKTYIWVKQNNAPKNI